MVRKIKVVLNTFCARSDLAAATLSSSVKWLLLRLRPSQSMTSVWIAMRCSTRVLSTLIEKTSKHSNRTFTQLQTYPQAAQQHRLAKLSCRR